MDPARVVDGPDEDIAMRLAAGEVLPDVLREVKEAAAHG